MTPRKCETCGEVAELVVYGLPGIPYSVGNCRNCFRANAYPLHIAKANTEAIGGLEHASEWWKEAITFLPDVGYTPVRFAVKEPAS